MFCDKCGKELKGTEKFCSGCGKKMNVVASGIQGRDVDIVKKPSIPKYRILFVINMIVWAEIFVNVVSITIVKSSIFMSLVQTYSAKASCIFYYGFAVLTLILLLLSMIGIRAANRGIAVAELIGNIIFAGVIVFSKTIKYGLSDKYMDSINSMILYTVTQIYENNIWLVSYLGLIVSSIMMIVIAIHKK